MIAAVLKITKPRALHSRISAFNPYYNIRFKNTAPSKPRPKRPSPESTIQNVTKLELPETQLPPESGEAAEARFSKLAVLAVIGTCTMVYIGFNGVLAYKAAAFVKQPEKISEYKMMFRRNMLASRKNIDEGRWWCAITSTFMHGSIWHLGFNMYGLWSLGWPLVYLYGFRPFASLWLISGVGGSLVGIYGRDAFYGVKKHAANSNASRVPEDRHSLGASGAISGMAGFMACVMPALRYQVVAFAGFSAFCISENWFPGLGHVEHLFGLASGVAFWFLRFRFGRR